MEPKRNVNHLDMLTGVYTGAPPQSVRRLGELAELFASPEAITTERRDEAVYEIHGPLADPNDPPRLLHATTVLYPGDVAGEYFMTRGHFHTNPERGEFMLTLSGEGALLLMDRSGSAWSEPMEQGSVHDIDGRHAHRVVNTGDGPLIFLVVWMSDCGHDYESIRERGFGQRVSCSSNVHL